MVPLLRAVGISPLQLFWSAFFANCIAISFERARVVELKRGDSRKPEQGMPCSGSFYASDRQKMSRLLLDLFHRAGVNHEVLSTENETRWANDHYNGLSGSDDLLVAQRADNLSLCYHLTLLNKWDE